MPAEREGVQSKTRMEIPPRSVLDEATNPEQLVVGLASSTTTTRTRTGLPGQHMAVLPRLNLVW